VETRAATDKFRRIRKGDTLVFVCGNEELEKKADTVEIYPAIDKMAQAVGVKPVMPFADSLAEMKRVYHSFPNYREKIRENGLVVVWLE